jgi:hypothetical protein
LENVVGGASAAYKVGEISITFDDSNVKTGGVVAHVSSSVIAVTYTDDASTNSQQPVIEAYDLVHGTATIVFTPSSGSSGVGDSSPSSGESVSSLGTSNSGNNNDVVNTPPSTPVVQEIPEQPEEKAIAACQNKSTGAACQFTVPEYVFTGTCSIITMGILECVPDSR